MNNIMKFLEKLAFKRRNSSDNRFSNVVIQRGGFITSDSKIGDYTYIGFNTFITKATIGKFCSIANNVAIGDGEHLLDKVSTSDFFSSDTYEELTNKKCVIGNDVWIGTHSIIKRGVTIGNGAVVGANSFVNKDVPPYAIVVGTPAKILKFRFESDKIEALEKLQWWNKDDKWLQSNKQLFLNINDLIANLEY